VGSTRIHTAAVLLTGKTTPKKIRYCSGVHRNFVVVGSSRALHDVAQALEPVAEIITIALDESAGVKPRGGVLEIQALNRSSDEVLRRLRPYAELGEVVIRIGEDSVSSGAPRLQLALDTP